MLCIFYLLTKAKYSNDEDTENIKTTFGTVFDTLFITDFLRE